MTRLGPCYCHSAEQKQCGPHSLCSIECLHGHICSRFRASALGQRRSCFCILVAAPVYPLALCQHDGMEHCVAFNAAVHHKAGCVRGDLVIICLHSRFTSTRRTQAASKTVSHRIQSPGSIGWAMPCRAKLCCGVLCSVLLCSAVYAVLGKAGHKVLLCMCPSFVTNV